MQTIEREQTTPADIDNNHSCDIIYTGTHRHCGVTPASEVLYGCPTGHVVNLWFCAGHILKAHQGKIGCRPCWETGTNQIIHIIYD